MLCLPERRQSAKNTHEVAAPKRGATKWMREQSRKKSCRDSTVMTRVLSSRGKRQHAGSVSMAF